MVNLFKCNICSMYRCKKYNENIDSSNCTSFLELDTLKVPMLVALLHNPRNTNSITELLKRVRLRIVEYHSYPYFKLILDRS